MRIEYNNSFKDLYRFGLYHGIHMPFNIIAYGLLFIVFSYPVYKAAFKGENSFAHELASFILVEILLLLVIVLFFMFLVLIAHLSKKNKTFYRKNILELHEDHIFTESKYGQSNIKWDIIQAVKQNRKYVFLYVMQHSAIVIPKSAFPDKDAVKEFVNTIKGKMFRK